jgi:hypothetical protein
MPLTFNFGLHCTTVQVKHVAHLVHFSPQKLLEKNQKGGFYIVFEAGFDLKKPVLGPKTIKK